MGHLDGAGQRHERLLEVGEGALHQRALLAVMHKQAVPQRSLLTPDTAVSLDQVAYVSTRSCVSAGGSTEPLAHPRHNQIT